MSAWTTLATAAAALNAALLLALTAVWARNYRRHGAAHTLAFLVFGGFLLVENLAWLWLYALEPAFYGWVAATGPGVQAGVAALCVLETAALLALARITLT